MQPWRRDTRSPCDGSRQAFGRCNVGQPAVASMRRDPRTAPGLHQPLIVAEFAISVLRLRARMLAPGSAFPRKRPGALGHRRPTAIIGPPEIFRAPCQLSDTCSLDSTPSCVASSWESKISRRARFEFFGIEFSEGVGVLRTPCLNIESDLLRRWNPSRTHLVTIDVLSQCRKTLLAEQSAAKDGTCVVFPGSVLYNEDLRPQGPTPSTHLRGIDVREPTALLASPLPERLLLICQAVLPDSFRQIAELCRILPSSEAQVIEPAFTSTRLGAPAEGAKFPAAFPDVELPFFSATLTRGSRERLVWVIHRHVCAPYSSARAKDRPHEPQTNRPS